MDRLQKYRRGWGSGLPETPCGSGSKLENTAIQREWIPRMIEKYNIKTISDIGAGDQNWIKHMDICGAEYTAYDLVPRHSDIIEFDIINEIPRQFDLILCLLVLNHFSKDDAKKAFRNIVSSGSRYLMVTDYFAEYQGITLPYIERVNAHIEPSINILMVDLYDL